MVENIKSMFMLYCGSGAHVYIFLILMCIILYRWKDAKKESTVFIFQYSIIMIVIFFFPITAKIIMDYCIGRDVYWRLIWTWPVAIVLAFVFTEIAGQKNKNQKMWIVLLAILIAASGNLTFNSNVFEKSSSFYKLPAEVPEICDIIINNNQNEEVKVVAPNELVSYLRQYSAEIKLAYGRESIKEKTFDSEDAVVLYDVMNNKYQDAAALAMAAMDDRCNYIVLDKKNPNNDLLRTEGYERIGKTEQYYIYYCDEMEEL